MLELPTDRPRPAMRTQTSGRHDHVLPAELVAAVKKLGAQHGASLFATLLAGFDALLARLTGQDDLVVGIPAAGQAAAGLEGLVGHCVSMLPLRPDRAQATVRRSSWPRAAQRCSTPTITRTSRSAACCRSCRSRAIPAGCR